MKIRHKMYTLLGLYVSGVLCIALMFMLSVRQDRRVRDSIILGMELQMQSREVKSLMKDIIFDLFAPKTYGQTRSLTYSPRSAATVTAWENTIYQYQRIFDEFMDSSLFLQAKEDSTRDQYVTAMVMNRKAMNLLTGLSDVIDSIRGKYRQEENIYNAMQKDASLTGFFNDFQETSYYFTNSFESFMNYFISSLREKAEMLQRRQYITLVVIASSFFGVALLFTLYLTRDIAIKTRTLELAFRDLSLGNFTSDNQIQSQDEFGQLSTGLRELVLNLKASIENLLKLSRDVTGVIGEHPDIDALLKLIVQAVLQDSSADAVRLYTRTGDGSYALSASCGKDLTAEGEEALINYISANILRSHEVLQCSCIDDESLPQAMLSLPLIVDNRHFGALLSIKTAKESSFSDLGISSLENFGEYASLTIDHFFKYRELMERREAQFQALQSQMQPHFIYNILGGMQGLARMGDQEGLRETIESLKIMLRYIQSSDKWTILEDEVDFIRNYCGLQKIRFGDRLTYRIDPDPDTLHIRIPRLLLQPLVENAVLHGIEPLEAGGMLTLETRAYRRGGETGAIITISDDGAGFDDSGVENAENIGLINVRQRLKIFMPDSSFTIKSRPGEGTVVELKL